MNSSSARSNSCRTNCMSRRGATYCPIGLLLTFVMANVAAFGLVDVAMSLDELSEPDAAARDAVFAVQQPRVVMDGEHQSVHGEDQLVRIGGRSEMADFDGLLDGADELALPRADHAHQKVSDGPGTIVVLDRARNEHASFFDLDAQSVDPARVHRAQAGQPARFFQARQQDALDETPLVLLQDGDLQFLAGAEMGENTGLGHVQLLGDAADRQPL